ncbi:MAG: diguanylate cyclase [Chloroflexi bacterium]|nr:diguanylate cyclase [Chloroflexota bacterium]
MSPIKAVMDEEMRSREGAGVIESQELQSALTAELLAESQRPLLPAEPFQGEARPDQLTRPFRLLRLGGVVAVASALLTATVTHLSIVGGVVPLMAEASVLLAVAMTGEAMLRWAEKRLRRERERAQRIWLSRQAELQEIASRDDLTQLQNRRFFYERLQEELVHADSHKKPLSIVMIDVDDLKAINDDFGHQVGDVVLRQFARILNRYAQENYVTARLGGDEFAVIMPGADRRRTDELAWRLWDELAASPVYESDTASIYLGVSIGSGGYPWGGNDMEEIIHWADAKLYANKLERKGLKGADHKRADNRLVSAVVGVLSTALEIRDRMTHHHSRRVARMAVVVAKQMGLSDELALEIEFAAALHDIGKIGVADSILRKADPLEPAEWREMRRHSELGYEILKGIDFLRSAAEIVYAHHERYDGKGYPRGLAGEEIPIGARVFAVVDAFDAMTSRRPYRDAMSREMATIEVARTAATQFDPRVVETFLAVVRGGPDDFYGDGDEEFGSRIVVNAARPKGTETTIS